MTAATAGVAGMWDPAFAGVADALAANLADGEDAGASVSVFVDGRPVVDIWGGQADVRAGRAWERDTTCVTFSCTKVVSATAALLLDDRGSASLADPVTSWWPEFGARGKDGATGEDLLAHTVGLPAFDRDVTAEEAADPAALGDLLAAQAPQWRPGTAHGYHALTFGWLAGEFVRRHADSSVAEFVARELGRDLHLGVHGDDLGRVARMAAARTGTARPPAGGPAADEQTLHRVSAAATDDSSPMRRSTGNPAANFTKPVVLEAGWPAAGLVCTARAFAGFLARLLDGTVLGRAQLERAVTERVRGADRTMITETAFGLGFMLPSETMFLPPAARAGAFGHPGASGALVLADPESGVTLAYLPNLIRPATLDRRGYRLVDAAYRSL